MTSTPTFALPDGRSVCFGRISPTTPQQHLHLKNYLVAGAIAPANVIDYGTNAMASLRRMYGNDSEGTCCIAAAMHQVGIWTGNESGPAYTAVGTAKEALDQYHAICPGGHGCQIPAVMNHMRDKGIVVGGKTYKIDGYVAIDWGNITEVKLAISIFGSVRFGIFMTKEWLYNPTTWGIVTSPIIGGHDVCAIGYNAAGVQVSTWGEVRTITWPTFLTGEKFIEECYVSLSPDWYKKDNISPSQLNLEILKDDLAKFANGSTLPPAPPRMPVPKSYVMDVVGSTSPLTVKGYVDVPVYGGPQGFSKQYPIVTTPLVFNVTGKATLINPGVIMDQKIFHDAPPSNITELSTLLVAHGVPTAQADRIGILVFTDAIDTVKRWFDVMKELEAASAQNPTSVTQDNLTTVLECIMSCTLKAPVNDLIQTAVGAPAVAQPTMNVLATATGKIVGYVDVPVYGKVFQGYSVRCPIVVANNPITLDVAGYASPMSVTDPMNRG